MLNTGAGEGGSASPSNPRSLAPLPERLAHRGRSPRTPAPVGAWRSGAPVWSAPTSRRQTSSPRRRPSGSPTSGSGPTRSSAASLSGRSTPSTASRTTRRPVTSPAAASTRPRAGCLPSRRDHSRRRRGLGATPGTGGESATSTLPPGPFFDTKGGVAPSPAPYDPDFGGQRGGFPRGTTGSALAGPGISGGKRGGRPSCVRTWPRGWPGKAKSFPDVGPGRAGGRPTAARRAAFSGAICS